MESCESVENYSKDRKSFDLTERTVTKISFNDVRTTVLFDDGSVVQIPNSQVMLEER